MAPPLPIRFVRSFAAADDLPPTDAELALVGRSNVGKSSLLNALAGRDGLARTSKSPGATRLLNGYEVGPADSRRWLVDLPGYGFAKVAKREQARWASMIDGYLREREGLVGVLHLIDGAVGPTPLDLDTVAWLHDVELPITFVATKTDKVRSSKRGSRRDELTTKLGVERGDVAWVSAAKGAGIAELRSTVGALLGID